MDYIHIDFYIETDALTSRHMIKKVIFIVRKIQYT